MRQHTSTHVRVCGVDALGTAGGVALFVCGSASRQADFDRLAYLERASPRSKISLLNALSRARSYVIRVTQILR